MAGIFPPASVGGVPPGPNVDNGLDPANPVTGEGPLYVSASCTTALTSGHLNALTSEILAAVDRLGLPFNANSITNLADALVAVLLTPLAGKVNKAGDTMAGALVLPGDPANPLEAAPKQYVDSHAATDRVLRAGDTMAGALVLAGNPNAALEAAPKQYVDAATAPIASGKVNRAGDVMTGALGLAGDPSAGTDAATKDYVDTKLAKAGGAMTGTLTLAADPTGSLDACTKNYADKTALYRGVWQVAPNAPDLNPAVMAPQNGWTWTAVTAVPTTPEVASATLPGIGGQTISQGDLVRWDAGAAAYVHIAPMLAELDALRAEIEALKARA